jgi:methionine-rich copper-binding protein CopC
MKEHAMNRILKSAALGLALVLTAAPALAHSTVKSTVPASGTVLLSSPQEVVINFNEAARLTSVVLVEAGMPERKLPFTPPSGSANTFTMSTPNLGSGRNEIKWKALSKDGHPISGSIIIVIRSGPALSTTAPTPGDATHQTPQTPH